MYLATLKTAGLALVIALVAACSHAPTSVAGNGPEILTIFPDGSMRLENRPIPAEDVVIYPDGNGGERAAVKVRLELHPPFYRDSIIVERIEETLVSDN